MIRCPFVRSGKVTSEMKGNTGDYEFEYKLEPA